MRPPTATLTAARRRARSSRGASRASRHADAAPPAGVQDSTQDTRPQQSSAGLFGVGDPDEDEDLPRNFSFDWTAYHATSGPTPLQEAVTAMFAEYASLYGRIAAWVTSTALQPMTLDVAVDISRQAEHFIFHYLTPLLGVLHAPKVHKLLRHVLDSIKLHGSLQNANTSGNEAQHKEDKVFYRRTNKRTASFTQQVVRQAQGSREVVNRINATDDDVERAWRVRQAVRNDARVGEGGAPPIGAAVASVAGDVSTGHSTLPAAAGGMADPRARGLASHTVADLSRRPGLVDLGTLLGMPLEGKLRVYNGLQIAARLDCGSIFAQTVRATPSFISRPWYDAVLIDAHDAASGHQSRQAADPAMLVGEVRLIFRQGGEDMAAVCLWEPVAPALGCPLEARSCTRLRWALPPTGSSDWLVWVIPASRIRRLVHVVPDFGELVNVRGIGAVPPASEAAMEEHREMRFFVNAFFPWA